MPNVVIADTSCFIILSNINELAILQKLYNQITTTPDVANEFGEDLPEWVIVKSPSDYRSCRIKRSRRILKRQKAVN